MEDYDTEEECKGSVSDGNEHDQTITELNQGLNFIPDDSNHELNTNAQTQNQTQLKSDKPLTSTKLREPNINANSQVRYDQLNTMLPPILNSNRASTPMFPSDGFLTDYPQLTRFPLPNAVPPRGMFRPSSMFPPGGSYPLHPQSNGKDADEDDQEEFGKQAKEKWDDQMRSDKEEQEKRIRWMDQAQAEARKRMTEEQGQHANQLISQAASLSEDIIDFMDEHPCGDLSNSIDDLDKLINKMEEMRSIFRSKHSELKFQYRDQYHPNLGKQCNETLAAIKKYLVEVRNKRKSIRDNEDSARTSQLLAKEKKLKFLGTEVRRTMSSLEDIFTTDMQEFTDEEITKRKNDLSDQLKLMQTIPKTIQEIMDGGEKDPEINRIKGRYDLLVVSKGEYVTELENQLSEREI